MANIWGYPVIQTDLAGLVITGGQVTVDGYGEAQYDAVPSGIVRSIDYNGTGNYTIVLQEAWYALVDVHIESVIPADAPVAGRLIQIQEITVGDPAVLPVQAGGDGQGVTFQVLSLAGADAALDEGQGFVFSLLLKASSA